MQTLSIQQAIFMTSTLREQLNREIDKFQTDYRMPIAVNGKSIVTNEKSERVMHSLNKIEQIKHDITALKTAVHHINSTKKIEYDGAKYTASSLLEELKLDRQLLNRLRSSIEFGYGQERMKTVSGVGVVEEGIIEEERIESYIENLEKTANDKSMLIDQFNATTTFDIELASQ